MIRIIYSLQGNIPYKAHYPYLNLIPESAIHVRDHAYN